MKINNKFATKKVKQNLAISNKFENPLFASMINKFLIKYSFCSKKLGGKVFRDKIKAIQNIINKIFSLNLSSFKVFFTKFIILNN
tara:strand:+ start:75 stop:329 length:255 start_codon:yes stop_codon:yes gene_type:complete